MDGVHIQSRVVAFMKLITRYQFLRLNLRDVLYNHHAANVFLAFLISRKRYQEVALWMDIHYMIFPLIKNANYPDNITPALDEILRNPTLIKVDDEVYSLVHYQLELF